jgi:HK97 family phage major capsid protein
MGTDHFWSDPQPRTVEEATRRAEAMAGNYEARNKANFDKWQAQCNAQVSTASAGRRTAEKRATGLQAQNDQLRAQLHVYEPPVYGPGSNSSYFQDLARANFGSQVGRSDKEVEAARDRLHRHELARHRETERRLAGLRAEAEYSAERALSRTRAEAALLHQWQAAGGRIFEHKHELEAMAGFETRALNRTDGSGGYFAPPGYLVDRFVHAPRAGAPFAALWQRLPMPPGISSVNLPRFKTGAASNVMTDGSTVPSRDFADSLMTANLITIAAQVDVSLQWLDQLPVPVDETIGADLAEDFAIQLDGQLLLGNGSAPQAQGVISGGTFSAANHIYLQNTNNAASQTWSNGGTDINGSVQQFASMLYSKICTYRGLEPTHFVTSPAVWAIASASADGQNRPLVPPGSPIGSRSIAEVPWVIDANLPNTFGGSSAPSIGLSSGVASPTDGNGTYTPIIAVRGDDLLYFQTEPKVRVMLESLAGTLQARFQVYTYIAAAPNRVVYGGTNQTFSGTSQGGGVNAGAAVAYGVLTQQVSNSILQPSTKGF